MNDDREHGSDGVGSPPTQARGWASTVIKLLIGLGIVVVALCLLLPTMRSAHVPALRNQCSSQLMQIALALQSYADQNDGLPPAYTTDVNGKPLHSWRTLILPYMEEQHLYNTIDLTKPWDDLANAAAFETIVSVYRCPSAREEEDNRTTYLAVVTPSSTIRANESGSLSEISDGASQSLMVVEVGEEHAVPWMEPTDADESVVLGIGSPESKTTHPGGFHAAFADGRVRFLELDTPVSQRRALISKAGNDKLETGFAE